MSDAHRSEIHNHLVTKNLGEIIRECDADMAAVCVVLESLISGAVIFFERQTNDPRTRAMMTDALFEGVITRLHKLPRV